MKRPSIALIFLAFILPISFASGAPANSSPADPSSTKSLSDIAYSGMDGFLIATGWYFNLLDELQTKGIEDDARVLSSYAATFALIQKDYELLLEIRTAGGFAPPDISPRFSPDAAAALSLEAFQSTESFLSSLEYKNKNRGYITTMLKEAGLELVIDAAYFKYQTALAQFESAAALAQTEGDKLASAGAATQSAYIAADLLVASSILEQNTKAVAYYKKYSAILDSLDNDQDRSYLITVLPSAVGAFLATGDKAAADEISKKLKKLKVLNEVASKGVLGVLDAKIAKSEVMYDMMSDKFAEIDMDSAMELDEGKMGRASGSGTSAEPPRYRNFKLQITNITELQFMSLTVDLNAMPGFMSIDSVTNEKNVVTAEMYTSTVVDSAQIAAFINTLKYSDLIINARADGEFSISAKATGIPREKFDASAASFEFIIMPDDMMQVPVVAELLSKLRRSGPTERYRHLLYLNVETAIARARRLYPAFVSAGGECPKEDSSFPRLEGLCASQRALAAADNGAYTAAVSDIESAQIKFKSATATEYLSRIAMENLIAYRIASGMEDNPAEAAKKLKQLAADATDEERINISINLANCLYAAGDFEAAVKEYENAAALADGFTRMEQAHALVSMGKGNSLIMLARHSEAADAFTQAVAQAETAASPILAASARAHLASVLLYTGDYEAAASNSLFAASSAEAFANQRLLWQALYTRGRALEGQGRHAEALDAYLASISAIESPGSRLSLKSGALTLDQQDAHRYAAALAAKTGNTELSLQILERSHNSALLEQFEKSRVAFRDPNVSKAAGGISGMKTTIATHQSNIEKMAPSAATSKNDIEAEKEKLQESQRQFIKYVSGLESTHSGLAALYNIEPVELVKVRKKLPPDLAIVYYLIGEGSLYIFYVRADSIGFKEVPVDTANLEAQVRLFRNLISTAPADPLALPGTTGERVIRKAEEAGGRLYDLLVKPIESHLSDIDKIAVIPNGILNFIPFEALSSGGKYLVEKYSIFYLDSLAAIGKEQNHGKSAGTLYAFGNADDTLPSAEKEVRDISTEFSKPTVYIREQATEERAKELSESGGVFHFATHGTLDFKDISKSFITLARGDGGDDGKFTIEEVWGYWWGDASLVALSACNTASGDLTVRGKAVNPASAFLNAGAPSVLATLWSVDDAATAQLMEKFYRNLSKMEKAKALRQAQIDLMKQPATSHPFYWAPFTLIGDWR